MGAENQNGGKKAFTLIEKIMMGVLSIPLATLIAFVAWGVHKVNAIETNKIAVSIVKADVEKVEVKVAENTRNVDKILIEQRHMMDDIKKAHEEARAHNTEVKTLMLRIINGSGH